jgi:hypothetical protein
MVVQATRPPPKGHVSGIPTFGTKGCRVVYFRKAPASLTELAKTSSIWSGRTLSSGYAAVSSVLCAASLDLDDLSNQS